MRCRFALTTRRGWRGQEALRMAPVAGTKQPDDAVGGFTHTWRASELFSGERVATV